MKGGNPVSLMGYWLASVPVADQQKTTFKTKNQAALAWYHISKPLTVMYKRRTKVRESSLESSKMSVCSCVSHVAVFSVTCLSQCRTLNLYLMDL